MNNDCINCRAKCCMAGVTYSAVFSREEADSLKRVSEKSDKADSQKNDYCVFDGKLGGFKMTAEKGMGCHFLNTETFACTAYDKRPLDCVIFPLEYRWWKWLFSPHCSAAPKFDKTALLAQLRTRSPSEIRRLKLLHLRTPESTGDKLWILLTKALPVAGVYSIYKSVRDFFDKDCSVVRRIVR